MGEGYPAFVFVPLLTVTRARGVADEVLLEGCDFGAEVFEQHDARVSAQGVRTLWANAARLLSDEALGLRVAEAMVPGQLDLLEYLTATNDTLGEALKSTQQHLALLGTDRIALTLESEPEGGLWIGIAVTRGPALIRSWSDFAIGSLALALRTMVVGGVRPVRVCSHHPRPRDTRPYARLFECALEFDATADRMLLPAGAESLRLAAADPKLRAILERQAADALNAQPQASPDLRDALCDVIAVALADSREPMLAEVASELRMGERTLKRRLQAEGTSFRALVDETRHSAALDLLADAQLSVFEVAQRLGFADASAFAKAFRRWHGCSPREYRSR